MYGISSCSWCPVSICGQDKECAGKGGGSMRDKNITVFCTSRTSSFEHFYPTYCLA